MLPATYHSNTSPSQCQPSISPQVPSIFPSVPCFLPPLYRISGITSNYTNILCALLSFHPTYFSLHYLSSQLVAEMQYELSISEGNTPVSTTETLARPKRACLPSHHFMTSGHEVGEPQKDTTLLISNTVSTRNSLK